jgi:hypothetical protein
MSQTERSSRRGAMKAKIGAIVLAAAVLSACTSSTHVSSGSVVPSSDLGVTPVLTGGFLVDVDTHTIRTLPPIVAGAGAYYAVSADRTFAFSSCCDSPAPVMTATTNGELRQRVTPSGWDGIGAQWSPDGSTLVYQQRHMSGNELGNLYTYDVATGRRTRITDFDERRPWGWWFTFPSFAPDDRSVLFQLPRGNTDDPVFDLWSVPVDGGKQTLVRRDAGFGGFAPDGTLAHLAPGQRCDVRRWCDLDEGRVRRPRPRARPFGRFGVDALVTGRDTDLV